MVPFNKIEHANRIGVVILAGGKSSRMGTNKALLPIGGKPVIERIRDEMRTLSRFPAAGLAASHVLIVTNDPDAFGFLEEETVCDKYPGLGPLAGIQAGLQASSCDWNLVVACDMPMVTAEAGAFMLKQAAERDIDAVVPFIRGQLHPLFAVYHKRCADKMEAMLIAERLRMIDLLEELRVVQVTEADFPAFVDTNRVFWNMNRPEEWLEVKQWLEIEGRGNE